MSISFSENCKEVVSRARIAALELGYDYIATVHFLIANATVNQENSLYGNMFFFTPLHLHTFCEGLRIGPPITDMELIPLTVGAEKSLLYATRLAAKYGSASVEPHHILLACFACPQSDIGSYIGIKEKQIEKIEEFYRDKGLIPEAKKERTFFGFIKTLFRKA
jgi:ATP-dependent Clp protease ATP-binding subunit ClpA